MNKTKSNQLLWLDLLRGLAALVVLMGHLRSVLFQDYENLQNPNALAKAFYFITGFGHQAVIIFFVLSGFFIIKSIHDANTSNKWAWSNYLVNRLSRLWMVLIPGLLLAAIWDHVGISMNPAFDIYSGTIPHLIYFNPIGHLGLDVFFGNMFFLQTVFFPTYGTNGALWSLSNEFWYYIIFPLLYLAYQHRRQFNRSIAFALLGLGILGAFQYYSFDAATQPLAYFFIWLFGGASLYLVHHQYTFLKHSATVMFCVMLLLAILGAIRLQLFPILFNDWSLGLATLLVVASLAQHKMNQKFLEKLSVFLSKISYTLYIVHLPFVVFLASRITTERLEFSTTHLGYYTIIFSITVIYAYLVYFLFERNTAVVKSFIMKKLS